VSTKRTSQTVVRAKKSGTNVAALVRRKAKKLTGSESKTCRLLVGEESSGPGESLFGGTFTFENSSYQKGKKIPDLRTGKVTRQHAGGGKVEIAADQRTGRVQ